MATKENPEICFIENGCDYRRSTGALRGVLKVLQREGGRGSHWGAIGMNPCVERQNYDPKGCRRWYLIDSTEFGEVFSTEDQVVPVEESNIYETRLVLLN